MKNKVTVAAQNFPGMVDLSKSKRLSSMRERVQVVEPRVAKYKKNKIELSLLEQAQALIEQTISEIKSTYPEGKKNSLFSLRYANEKKMSVMTVGEVFKLLKLNDSDFSDVRECLYKK